MNIIKDYNNRLFDNEVEDTYGVFVRKLGGYQKYYEWKTEISKPKKMQGRNELCACGSGKKFKKCCLDGGKK